MITRSKLVEQLRDYQIRSQNTYPALIFFSPKPHIASWVDVAVAIFCAFVFSLLAGSGQEEGEKISITLVDRMGHIQTSSKLILVSYDRCLAAFEVDGATSRHQT
ncbi:hypothetical protein GQ457_14G003900 [Hibiscus cannabinus]